MGKIETIGKHVRETLFKKYEEKLQDLYKLQPDEIRRKERDELIDLSAKILWEAQELTLNIFKANNITYPDTKWKKIREQISMPSYVYIEWEDLENEKTDESDKDIKNKIKSISGKKEELQQIRIKEAKEANLRILRDWCMRLKQLIASV